MPNVEIKQLYNLNRVPTDKTLTCLCYLPIGIFMVTFRLLIFLPVLLLSLILPSTHYLHAILLKFLCYTFGISVNVENIDRKEDVDAYISNHVTILDHVAMKLIARCVKPSPQTDTPLSLICGEKYFGPISNLETFKNNLSVFMTGKTPVYFQPEDAMTNGKAVLKFNTWPFSLCSKFQPVVIQINRPILNIATSTINSSYWADMFFFLFSPVTIYNVQFLPSIEGKAFPTEELANNTQQKIAEALRIEAVQHNSSDVKEWLKRHLQETNRPPMVANRTPVNTSVNAELSRMGMQVKEVLPMVPMKDILKDLVKTRNVDVTITNILDGAVLYTPEKVNPVAVASTSSAAATLPSGSPKNSANKDPFNTAADTFGKSASERNLSFQERKRLLIENARRRYIEKHGLNLVALNNC